MKDKTGKPGDCVIIEDASENWTIYRITAEGTREFYRRGSGPRDRARSIARSEIAPGGTVWIGNQETPDQIAPY